MDIILIAAMAANRVIGRNNAMPWHIPEELRFFKATTIGHPVVMGRKTFESLKAPLSGRRNIVISRNPAYHAPGALHATSLRQAITLCQADETVFILGGSQVFARALPLADGIILTVLDRAVSGDVYFPEFSTEDFEETKKVRHEKASEPFTVHYYRRIR